MPRVVRDEPEVPAETAAVPGIPAAPGTVERERNQGRVRHAPRHGDAAQRTAVTIAADGDHAVRQRAGPCRVRFGAAGQHRTAGAGHDAARLGRGCRSRSAAHARRARNAARGRERHWTWSCQNWMTLQHSTRNCSSRNCRSNSIRTTRKSRTNLKNQTNLRNRTTRRNCCLEAPPGRRRRLARRARTKRRD